jgi:hypothetical protein
MTVRLPPVDRPQAMIWPGGIEREAGHRAGWAPSMRFAGEGRALERARAARRCGGGSPVRPVMVARDSSPTAVTMRVGAAANASRSG